MTGKEALENIKNELYIRLREEKERCKNDKTKQECEKNEECIKPLFDIIEKRIDVLLLVIRKGVETYWLEHTTNVDEYNKKIANLRETFSLNEEEYKLVKEVFRNDK